MHTKLKSSVGRGGVNHSQDVKLAQQLLNQKRPAPFRLLREDGVCGPLTISAIEEFQKHAVRMAHPDGKIDPGGGTIQALGQAGGIFIPGIPPQFSAKDKIAWGSKVSKEFKAKVIEICKDLGIEPDYLMSCMAFETGQTFSPSVKNKAGSGATGLIQFMPSTAKGLGTTTEVLAAMSAERQLDYVRKYFQPYSGRLKTLEDVYMAIFTPAAIGKSADHQLYKEGSKAYTQNRGFDANKDGVISLAEISTMVRHKYTQGMKPGVIG